MSALNELLVRWRTPTSPASKRCAALLRSMASVPYENLSKILERGRRRSDEEVARDHLNLGTGGTCFSLVSLFLALARRAGLSARPVFADRSYGADTHCAAVVTRVVGDTQVYLRDRYHHVTRRSGSIQRELSPEEVVLEIGRLGIAPTVAEEAWGALRS